VIEDVAAYTFYLPEGTVAFAAVYKSAPPVDPDPNGDGNSGNSRIPLPIPCPFTCRVSFSFLCRHACSCSNAGDVARRQKI